MLATRNNDSLRTRRLTHLLWLVMALAPLLAAVSLSFAPDASGGALTLFGVSLPATCWSRRWLGVSCPTCGISRAMVLFAHGRWSDAFRAHPAGPLLYLGLAAEAVYQLARSLRPAWRAPARLDRLRIGMLASVLALSFLRWLVRWCW